MARKLCIAVSVLFGALTLLLLVMWVRSYWRLDWIAAQRSGVYVDLSSLNGGICLDIEEGGESFRRLEVSSRSVNDIKLQHATDRTFQFVRHRAEYMDMWFAPHWFLAAIAGALTVVCAVHRNSRFSLRSLLIAMALVAIALGLAV